MKKRYIAVIAILVFIAGSIVGHLIINMHPSFMDNYQFSTGHLYFSENGEAILVNDSATVMRDASKNNNLFDSIKNGDRVFIIHGITMTTYPGQSGAYYIVKLPNKGSANEETLNRLQEMGWIETQ